MAREEMVAATKALMITMDAKFVPFSRSRNKNEKSPSLNWKITIKRDGRDVITTDYMQGCGHCAAYKAPVSELGHANSVMRDSAIRYECENGFAAKVLVGVDHMYGDRKRPLLPDVCDVLASLVLDAGALDYGMFEEWASDCGYDADSRSAKKIYRACLEIGLKLRASFGENGLTVLREAAQDY